MTRAVISLVLVSAAACDGAGSAGPPSASRVLAPPTVASPNPMPSEVPSSATTTLPSSSPPGPERPPPLPVSPRTLAASWQSYVGQRVTLACRPVRRLDFVRTLVAADGARFVITGTPDVSPCSARTSTFTVMGSTSVPLGGRTVLPELLLEEDAASSSR